MKFDVLVVVSVCAFSTAKVHKFAIKRNFSLQKKALLSAKSAAPRRSSEARFRGVSRRAVPDAPPPHGSAALPVMRFRGTRRRAIPKPQPDPARPCPLLPISRIPGPSAPPLRRSAAPPSRRPAARSRHSRGGEKKRPDPPPSARFSKKIPIFVSLSGDNQLNETTYR